MSEVEVVHARVEHDWFPNASDYDGLPVSTVSIEIAPLALFQSKYGQTFTITRFIFERDAIVAWGKRVTKDRQLSKSDRYEHFVDHVNPGDVPTIVSKWHGLVQSGQLMMK